MAQQWFYSHPGQQPMGPCSAEDLRKLVMSGKLGRDDLIWREGAPSWRTIGSVPDLAKYLPTAAAAAGPEEDFSFTTEAAAKPAAAAAPVPSPAPASAPASAPAAQQPARDAAIPAAAASVAPVPAEPARVVVPEVAAAPRRSAVLGFLHAALPKPILFGLYGAVGGLLGVLLLGELVWAMLHPAVAEMKPIRLAVSPALTVYPGTQNKIAVKIARIKVEGPVRLAAVSPPAHVQVSEATIAADENEAELVVQAGNEIKIGDYPLFINASAPGMAEGVSERISLRVVPTPPTLQVSAPPSVMIYPGANNSFGVVIARRLFEHPVQLEVLNLPPKVQIPLQTLNEKQNDTRMNVTVAKDIEAPTAHLLTLQARSVRDATIVGTTQIELRVIPIPGKLQLAAPKSVMIYPDDKNKFTVQIARFEFDSPVQIEVADLPPGVQIPPVVIPAKATSAVLEVSAGKSLGQHDVRVLAQAVNDKTLAASQPMKLTVAPLPPTVQLAVSPKVSVYAGHKATFGVKIGRNRFEGPVTVELPSATKKGKGPFVSSPITIAANQDAGEIEVGVDASFLAKKLPATVSLPVLARGPQGTQTTENVQVVVLPPPSDLHMTVSPEVEVYQGGKCRFTIKVARTGFVGPVQLQFNGLPDGFTLPSVSVPGDQIVLDGQAALKTPVGKHKIEVKATSARPAPDGKTPAAADSFTLIVKPLDPSKRPPPLDIVFVLDVTNSMDPQIKGIRDGIGQFGEELKKNELEARIGMVAFRDIEYDKEALKVLQFVGGPFTTDTKAYSTEVGKLKADGGGDEPESSLDAIVKAAEQPFRGKALKVLLLITDAPPQTKGNSVRMPTALKVLKDKGIDQVHLIVQPRDLPTYQQLQQVAKGSFFDLQKTSKAGFASLLPILSNEIARTTVADQPAGPLAKEPPPLPKANEPAALPAEKTPNPPSEKAPAAPAVEQPTPPKANPVEIIRVAPPALPVAADVAPPQAEAPTLQSVQSTAVFEEKDRWQVLIAIALWTAVVAAGIALTLVGGQKLYLQQRWPTFGDMGKALLAGFVAGLAGGFIGQWFFQSTALTLGARLGWLVDVVGRVLGWTLLGGLIGAGMGFFVPNLKLKRAFLGGCVGGAVGALVFALLSRFAPDMVGRWLGAAVVGFSIGLMIALAEVAFRRYWLEVAFGEREIRTVTLGPDTLAIGGDEKLAAVFVAGAPAKALGYRVDKNRVFCEDFGAEKTMEVQPGDQRELGRAKIRVCSAASATPTGASLRLVQVRHLSLMEGMPLTAEDVPGLEAQGRDGIVALVSRRPSDPKTFLLRNRSKQPWTITEAGGKTRTIEPGLGLELTSPCEIDFGQVKATLDPGK